MTPPIHVMVVDDSSTARQMLVSIINRTPDMRVIADASSGSRAIEMIEKVRPDVVLMDIVMPGMDGLQVTEEIMALRPTPIVLISASLEAYETDIAFRAIRAGALTVLQKPAGFTDSSEITRLLNTVRAMSGVQVIHHYKRPEPAAKRSGALSLRRLPPPELVAVCASTGGPAALNEIIRSLPASFRLPLVIVQHIAPEFVGSLVAWFKSNTALEVRLAHPGEQPQPGSIYLAPGDAHLRINADKAFEQDRRKGLHQHMPSGDVLFDSVAASYGKHAVGVILTGMGGDGARGLQAMHQAGAFTIAQDEASSVVFGMPAEAVRLRAARQVLPISEIGPALSSLSLIGSEIANGDGT